MRIEIPVCPECGKELSGDEPSCPHCMKPIAGPKFISLPAWKWTDRCFLICFAFMIAAFFFMPWFPGEFLFRESPLSPIALLLNLIDLEVDFLESYDILRMTIIIPLFSLFLFSMVYMEDRLKKTPFPGLFLIICILSASGAFIWQNFSGAARWGILAVSLGAFIWYLVFSYKRGTLGRITYYMVFIFFLVCMSLYCFDLAHQFYLHLETIQISRTWGFFLVWITTLVLMGMAVLSNMRCTQDLWIILFTLAFSFVAYTYLVHPFFVSGPIKFISDNLPRMTIQLLAHIRIVGIALVAAVIIGLPTGVYITRRPGLAGIVLYISSILITIPSIAMFGFMMPILSSIDRSWDAVSGIGIGVVPAISALALYSLLPIVRNTYIALKSVDPATVEAGKGMGMTSFQLLVKLQLPLSAPIIMAGVRTAVVMGIAIAAIAAYIGAGGLGLFVSEGLEMSTNDSVIAGALAMSVLAVAADVVLGKTEEWITPKGLKIRQAGN